MAQQRKEIFMTTYKKIRIEDQDIFYRKAGNTNSPAILLLHGFPTSSHMFRGLIPRQSLAHRPHPLVQDKVGACGL